MTRNRRQIRCASRRGFSLIEMLVALAITASLLAASLVALDTSFKGYKMTTDTASTHVVTRIVVHRIAAMIRTGTEFGPYPLDVLDPAQNPMITNFVEFISAEDPAIGYRQVTRIEAMPDLVANDGTLVLMLIVEDDNQGNITTETHPLIRGLVDATFTLKYDIGPKLERVTIDMTVRPQAGAGIGFDGEANTIRMVTSASPRSY